MSKEVQALLSAVLPGDSVLAELVRESHMVRESVSLGSDSEDLQGLHTLLVRNRGFLERLEELYSSLTLLKSAKAGELAHAKGVYEDAFAQVASKRQTVGFNDFASGKERDARLHAACTAQSVQMREAQRAYDTAFMAWDYVRLLVRGAESTQREVETRIRLSSTLLRIVD
jgi:hypothetical protein